MSNATVKESKEKWSYLCDLSRNDIKFDLLQFSKIFQSWTNWIENESSTDVIDRSSMHPCIYIYMIQTWQVWDRQLEYMLSWYTCWLVLLSELVRTLLAIFTMFQVLWMWIFVNGNGHPKWFSDTGPSTYEESMKSSKYLISMDLINYCSRCLFTSFWVTDCKEPDANSVTTIVTEY